MGRGICEGVAVVVVVGVVVAKGVKSWGLGFMWVKFGVCGGWVLFILVVLWEDLFGDSASEAALVEAKYIFLALLTYISIPHPYIHHPSSIITHSPLNNPRSSTQPPN